MHAVVVRVTVTDREGAEQRLRDEVVPQVSSAPGFQAGYWTRDGDSGLSMVIFDSEENARASAERVPGTIPEDVNLEGVEVREVVVSA
jgi:heme-degrading monooxygenase HmoA